MTPSPLRCGLIGQRLAHSFSPLIHRQLGDYSYELFPLEPREVGPFLQKGDFTGLNVTIPYKKTVLDYCSELSPAARHIGSVNTILRREDGSLYGHNTDYDGLIYLLKTGGITLHRRKVLILGSGGASLTAQAVCRNQDAREVAVISRSGPDHYGNLEKHADGEIIINATPVGMYPDTGVAPLDLSRFPHCVGVVDLVYNPVNTRLVQDARALSIPAVSGMAMLVAQAKAAAELFTGKPLADSLVDEITEDMLCRTTNLLLIGMPGSGKTTIGSEVARRLGRKFVDIDDEIIARTGCPIPQIFQSRGEAVFRALEHQALERACRESGLVIAAGGGAVVTPENHSVMRQNSRIVFLQRELSKLAIDGRPISLSRPLDELYRERLPLYEALSDFTVDNNREIGHAAHDIIKRSYHEDTDY